MAGAGIARATQVHGNRVVRVENSGLAGEADAVVTATPGLFVVVRVADCVPVLVAGKSSVGAIHAGWRGVAAGVVATAIEALGEEYPVAAVGPCIGVAAYEVGEEVVESIAAAGVPESIFLRRGFPRPHVDLRRAVGWQLREAGCETVDLLEPCTYQDRRFFSYRRDGAGKGHQAGFIGIVPATGG